MDGREPGSKLLSSAVGSLIMELSGRRDGHGVSLGDWDAVWVAKWILECRARLVTLVGPPPDNLEGYNVITDLVKAWAARFEPTFREMFAVRTGATTKEAIVASLWLLHIWLSKIAE